MITNCAPICYQYAVGFYLSFSTLGTRKVSEIIAYVNEIFKKLSGISKLQLNHTRYNHKYSSNNDGVASEFFLRTRGL